MGGTPDWTARRAYELKHVGVRWRIMPVPLKAEESPQANVAVDRDDRTPVSPSNRHNWPYIVASGRHR